MLGSIVYHIVVDIYSVDGEQRAEAHQKDYRLGHLGLISFDMDDSTNSKKPLGNTLSTEPLKARHIGQGVIRLYREPEEFEEPKEQEISSDGGGTTDDLDKAGNNNDDLLSETLSSISLKPKGSEDLEKTIISILAIPGYFTVTDILGFIGDDYIQNHISNVRIIKADISNRFLVLLNFRSRKYAKKFKKEFNGRLFNSMEPETCHVIYVKSVIFKRYDDTNDNNYFLDDPFTSTTITTEGKINHGVLDNKKPTPDLRELPTCPVCLERMDSSVTGLLTIPCQHTFHCQCLRKWQDDSCPICRYSSLRQHAKNLMNHSSSQDNVADAATTTTTTTSATDPHENGDKCGICEISDNLWICLICGSIACGRYNHAHAINHYNESGHCFAMDINSQRIWDYASDCYVHRLIRTENDGKLVELPSREEISEANSNNSNINNSNNQQGPSGSSAKQSGKISSTSYMEYSQILVTQLESQREYYELKLKDMWDKFAEREVEVRDLLDDVNSLKQNIIKTANDDYKRLQNQASASIKELQSYSRKYEEERALANGMSQKITSLDKANKKLLERLKEKELEKQELQSQVKDLMFYLESQEKFQGASDEIKEGTVVIQNPASSQTSSASAKKKKKR
ncbi:Etp1 protein [Saccharomycopsis crataegensis]|uniref:Etp1 protein n=1 Tax=Saccharomycopsis crataegensis TaxID=43959 RepID=A0AAV5QSN3_9ASCO|nr:Etp1 protein [Saccharomycopsis crataegensis]